MAVVTSAVAVFITLSAAATCLESPMSCSAENNTSTYNYVFPFTFALLFSPVSRYLVWPMSVIHCSMLAV